MSKLCINWNGGDSVVPDVACGLTGRHAPRGGRRRDAAQTRRRNGCATARKRGGPAFTLIELLVVIAIIGVLAAVGLPKLKGFGASNATIAATRQLLDDVSFARSRAMASRSDVYIVFVPPASKLPANLLTMLTTDIERQQATNLYSGQYATYALFSERSVGDQPGVKNPRYLTPWKTLPNGTFIATSKFFATDLDGLLPFNTAEFPFPLATSPSVTLPYIAFNYQGRATAETNSSGTALDTVLPLARGSIFYNRDANGKLVAPFTADVLENPPNNSRMTNTTWNHIVIDKLTGRPRVERQEVQ